MLIHLRLLDPWRTVNSNIWDNWSSGGSRTMIWQPTQWTWWVVSHFSKCFHWHLWFNSFYSIFLQEELSIENEENYASGSQVLPPVSNTIADNNALHFKLIDTDNQWARHHTPFLMTPPALVNSIIGYRFDWPSHFKSSRQPWFLASILSTCTITCECTARATQRLNVMTVLHFLMFSHSAEFSSVHLSHDPHIIVGSNH